MGKKSKESTEDNREAVKFLFGTDNPFRRKPQVVACAGDNSQPKPQLGLGLDFSISKDEAKSEAEITGECAFKQKTRKRKRDADSSSLTPIPASSLLEPNTGKRKKVEDEAEGLGFKTKKKRKRDDVEAAYERRMYGLVGEDETTTAVAVGEKRKASDVDVDMIEVKESFDDESKLLRTIFVGNLPLKTKRKALQREFARFGEIESVRIRSVPLLDTKAPRKAAIFKGKINESFDSVNSYIVFKDEQSARAALTFNMALIGGNHIRVDMACPPRKKMKGETKLYDRKKTVFVGNLPFDVKDEELYQLFCSLSQPEQCVEAVRVIRDSHTSIGKGFAYVLFKTRDAANRVCKRRDLNIRDRDLRICHAKTVATTPAKRKEPPRTDTPHEKRRASTNAPSPNAEKTRKSSSSSLSYQGLRSSKTGIIKKTRLRPPPTTRSYNNPTTHRRNTPKGRQTTKRPAVAARKAKQLLLKRKQMANTPDNKLQYKKARRQ